MGVSRPTEDTRMLNPGGPGDQDMTRHEANKPLSEEQRREVFRALVEAQDRRMTVPQSRKAVAAQFGVSEQQVRRIEQEGLNGSWPPL